MIRHAIHWTKKCTYSLLALLLFMILLLGTLLFTHPGLKLVLWGAEKALPQLHVKHSEGALLTRFSLSGIHFKDDNLHLDARLQHFTLDLNGECLFDPRICVDEMSVSGLRVDLPQLPPSDPNAPQTEPARSISSPIPIAVNDVHLDDIQLMILGNRVSWKTFSTALTFQGDHLVIAPTALKTVRIKLAEAKSKIAKPPTTLAPATAATPSSKRTSSKQPASAPVDSEKSIKSPTQQSKQEMKNSSADKTSQSKAPLGRQDITLPDVWIPLQIDVQQFDMDDFLLQGKKPVIVNHLGISLTAGDDKVNLKQLTLKMPEVDAHLQTQITLSGDYPLNTQLDALLHIKPAAGQKIKLTATGSIADLTTSIDLSKRVTGHIHGRLQPLKAILPFDISVHQLKAQWPLQGSADYHAQLKSLQTSGSLQHYKLNLDSSYSGKSIPDTTLNVRGQGDLQQIKIQQLLIKTLGGEIFGKVEANWAKLARWHATLNLKHIQPGKQWPQAEGDISGGLETSGNLTAAGGWQVALPKLNIDGILRKLPLKIKGQLQASDMQGNGDLKLYTPELVISHGFNFIRAHGDLDKKWLMDLDVHFPNIAKSAPQLQGSMLGHLQLRGTLQQPDLDIDLQLKKLKWQKIATVDSVSLLGRVSPLPKPHADLHLTVKQIAYQGTPEADKITVDQVDLGFAGDEQQHQLTLDVASKLASTSLLITGKLQQKPSLIWQGALERLSLTTIQGRWDLNHSTAIKINKAKQQINVAAHCWVQSDSKVCLAEDIDAGKVGQAKVNISHFDFEQLKPILPKGFAIEGLMNAQAQLDWSPNKKPMVKLHINVPQGKVTRVLDRPVIFGWDRVDLQAQLINNQLNAKWLVAVTDNGDFTGHVAVKNISSKQGVIDGRITLTPLKLDFLAPLLGEYSAFHSVLSSDLRLSGNVKNPQVNGDIKLDKLMIKGDVIPMDINDGQVNLTFSGDNGLLNAHLTTPDGLLNINGDADWQDLNAWRANAHVFAKQLKIMMPPMVKMIVEPDMNIQVTPTLARITGKLSLPWGRIHIESLPPDAISVSKDQVLLNEDLTPLTKHKSTPFNVETDVNIFLGEDFRLEAFGLKGDLQGKLNVTQKNKGPFIVGEVNIVNGTYRSFGQDLIIKKGKVLLNGPADQPFVDIKAIRNPDNTQDDVIAGIKVTGSASEPSVKIFSEPAMAQANALSYLLRGQNIDGESTGGNAMTTALIGLSLAKSGKVVGEIGEAFGVQDLQLDTAGSGEESQVTVSGYILPGLQVKYGVGIFDSLGEFTMRYRLMTDLYVEAVSGVESAVDLLYQFEFN